MPIQYKAVAVNDSLIDILQHWNLFNSWISEFPEPFNHKELKYWSDLLEFDQIHSIKSGKVELIEDEINGWGQCYTELVKVEINSDVFYSDTIYWYPKFDLLRMPGNGKVIQFSENQDTVSIMNGKDWEIDVANKSWTVHSVVNMEYK